MPGIAGVVDFEAGSAATDPEAMARALGLGASHHEVASARLQRGGLARAARTQGIAGATVARAEARRVVVAVDGELLEPGGPRSAPAAATALALYLEKGIDFVSAVTGFFTLAIWDEENETLYFANDRSGLRPFFFHRTEAGRVLFASEVKGILAATGPLAPDPHGITDLIVFGFPLETRTLFQGLQGVPPGSITAIRKGSLEQRQYRRLEYAWEAHRSVRRSEWVERTAECFRSCLRAMVEEEGPYAVPLSGGMDSRIIAAGLHADGRKALTYTIGSEGSRDVAIGRMVARRLRTDHREVVLDPEACPLRAKLGVYLTDGMFPALDTHILHVAEEIPAGVQVTLDGTSSFDGMYSRVDPLIHRVAPGRYGVMQQLDWVFTQPLFDLQGRLTSVDLFSRGFLGQARESYEASRRELVAGIPEGLTDPFDRVDYLEQTQRVRRYNVLGTVLLRNYTEVRHPFFHPELIELIETVPPGLRAKEKPISGMLAQRYAPELEGVPYERTGLRPDASLTRILGSYAAKLFRKGLQKAFPGAKARKRGVAIDYPRWLAENAEMQAFFRDTLVSDRSLERGYFDPDVLKSLVENQIAGRAGRLPLLNRLASLELWHRYFLEGEAAPRDFGKRSSPVDSRTPVEVG